MKHIWITFCALAFVIGGVACSEDTEDAARDAAGDIANDVEDAAEEAGEAAKEAADRAEDVVNDDTVNIDNFAYEPAEHTVSVGSEVTWVNQDDAEHTVTAANDSFGSERLGEGDEFSERFTEAGTFEYHCEVHGADRMSGTITVES